MATKQLRPKEGLVFSPVRCNRSTARGVLTDNQGNTFDIQIIGTDHHRVEDFINYQLKQAEKGKGIQIKVLPYKPLTSKSSHKKQLEPYTQTFWNGLSIRITERDVKTPKPYRLQLLIDPPIGQNEVQDHVLEGQSIADVQCSVSKGRVNIEVFEFTDTIRSFSETRLAEPVNAGAPKTLHLAQQFTGNWNVRVTGQDAASKYKLRLDLIVN